MIHPAHQPHKPRTFSITILIVFLTVLWFGLTEYKELTTGENQLYNMGAIWGLHFTIPNDWYRLISPIFVHLDIGHLISNMFILIYLGRRLENIIGNYKLFTVYLLSGIIGNLAVLWFNPLIITAGASGAIFGLFGYLFANRNTDYNMRQIYSSYSSLILINLFYTFYSTGVSIPGHIGGLVGGFIIGILFSHRPHKIISI